MLFRSLLAYTHAGTKITPQSHSFVATQAKFFTETSWFSREVLFVIFGSEIYEPGIIQIQAQCIRRNGFVDDSASRRPAEIVAALRRAQESTP